MQSGDWPSAFLCPEVSPCPSAVSPEERSHTAPGVLCSEKQPFRALVGGAGACLAARFHPSWPPLLGASQAHRVHSQADRGPLHPLLIWWFSLS